MTGPSSRRDLGPGKNGKSFVITTSVSPIACFMYRPRCPRHQPQSPQPTPTHAGELEVTGTILSTCRPPRPGSPRSCTPPCGNRSRFVGLRIHRVERPLHHLLKFAFTSCTPEEILQALPTRNSSQSHPLRSPGYRAARSRHIARFVRHRGGGPLAASTTMCALICGAISSVSVFSVAAGIRMSQSQVSNSSLVIASPCG